MPRRAMTLEEFAERLNELAELKSESTAIGVTDAEAAAYALVLEYGSIAGQRPWPHPGERTVAAVNPETGSVVVVSARAPQGFIRVRASQFLNELRHELAEPVDWLDPQALGQHLGRAGQAATTAALEQIRSALPRDSGRLARSLEIVD